jgi:hypothetical protein
MQDDIKELDIATDTISVQLRAYDEEKGFGDDHWTLAKVWGGIEQIRVRRRGNITTIRIKSPEARLGCDDVDRPPQHRSPGRGASKACPS